MRGLAIALALLVYTQLASAAIHSYGNEYFYSVGDAYIFRGGREGLFASTKEALEKWGNWGQMAPGVANGQSEIKFTKLEFYRPEAVANEYAPDEGFTGLIQAVIFEVGDRGLIGYPTASGHRYCCTKELVSKTKCFQDRLIYKEKPDGWPKVLDIYFENNETVAYSWEEAITIEKTGMYYLWFVICDEDLSAATVHGQTTWKNPAGYLPGMMYPNIKFFMTMTLMYLALAAIWLALYASNWKDVITLQHYITAITVLGIMEMSTWYFDYVNFNATGFRPHVTTLYAVLLGCIRKTLSRVLVLVVSMGYGVVLPYLGAMQKKVIALGVTYFIAVCALDTVSNVGTIDDLTSAARVLLVVPVAILDAIFILWVFTSLSKTLSQLQGRKQTAKLELYKKFTNTLALWVWISVGWIGYELYYKVTDSFNEKWQSDWLINGFWHLLNFAFLCVISWLWRPSHTATRYAFTEGEDAYDGGESGELLKADAKARKVEAFSVGEGGEELSKME